MAFGRYMEQGIDHMEKGRGKIWCKVTVSSGTPTLASGNGVTSVARSAEGKWLITLTQEFKAFMGGKVSFLGTTEVGRNCQFGAAPAGSDKTISVWFYDQASPGNLDDPPNTTVFIDLDLDMLSGA